MKIGWQLVLYFFLDYWPCCKVRFIISYKQPSAQPIGSETHGGDDVGIWAIGPMSHLVHGVHQQSYIAHVMAYSACIGPHDNANCRLRMASGAQNKVKLNKG